MFLSSNRKEGLVRRARLGGAEGASVIWVWCTIYNIRIGLGFPSFVHRLDVFETRPSCCKKKSRPTVEDATAVP